MIKRKSFTVQLVCVLLISITFASFAFLLVTSSVKSYRNITYSVSENNELRSCLLYTANKIRANDSENCISIQNVNGTDALMIIDKSGNSEFRTILYWYHGSLMEQYSRMDADIKLEDGNVVVTIPSFEIKKTGDSFVLTASTGSGQKTSLEITPECRQG